MSILTEIVAAKRRQVAAEMAVYGARPAPPAPRRPHSMSAALRQSSTGIIAEFKRRSPSRGEIHAKADPAVIVPGYAAAGAAACSVLTDTPFFGGALTDLMVARQAAPNQPLLRKDFVIGEFQIYQAYAAGADAVLLIAAILSAAQVEDYTALAHSLGMEVLFEVHGADELDRFHPSVDMVGVNNRNLRTFRTDPMLAAAVAEALPAHTLRVAESGLTDMAQIRRLRDVGFGGFLIGETFMRHTDPAAALADFVTH